MLSCWRGGSVGDEDGAVDGVGVGADPGGCGDAELAQPARQRRQVGDRGEQQRGGDIGGADVGGRQALGGQRHGAGGVGLAVETVLVAAGEGSEGLERGAGWV